MTMPSEKIPLSFPTLPAETNVVAVGLDIESVARVRDAMARHGESFSEKVFTDDECAYCSSRGNAAAESFAARWAAKEAFAKALGTGIGEAFAMTDAGVVPDANGAPFFKLSARAEKKLRERGAARALVSLSHTRELAAAIVVFVS